MNATDKAEALRLVDAMGRAAFAPAKFNGLYNQLRSFLSAQGEAEPSVEHWRLAFTEWVDSVDWQLCSQVDAEIAIGYIAQRARELAQQGVGNG